MWLAVTRPLCAGTGCGLQRSITKATKDGQCKIDQAAANAITARATAGNLQRTVDDLTGRFAA